MGRTVLYMGSSTTWSMGIAARVNATIEDSGLSVRTVAERSGIARETLRRRLENQTPFTIDELEALAEVLNVGPDSFLNSAYWPAPPLTSVAPTAAESGAA